jgi:hypothetical protein
VFSGGESRKRVAALLVSALLLLGLLPPVVAADKLKETAIQMGDTHAAYGEAVTFRSWLYRPLATDNEKYLSGMTVTYKIDGAPVGTAVTNPAGSNQNRDPESGLSELPFRVQLPPGYYTVEASFAGDAKYDATATRSTLVVEGPVRIATQLDLVNVSGAPGGTATLTAWLKDQSGNPVPQQPVTFAVGGVAAGSAVTDTSGMARLAYNVGATPGSYPVTAAFAGSPTYFASTASATLTVVMPSKIATSLTLQNAAGNPGTTIMLQAALRDQNGQGLTGQAVTFSVDGVVVGSALTTQGLAQLAYPISATAAEGVHALTAAFAGDAQYDPASQAGALTIVVPKPTSITIGSAYGQTGDTITLRSWLQGNGQYLSGQTVEYYVNGSLVGSAVTNANGAALPGTYLYGQSEFLYVVNLPAGTYELKARFAGNVNYKECFQVSTLQVAAP